jgi:hypothetical protein
MNEILDELNKLDKTMKEIREIEKKHYFVDHLSADTATWYRSPWIPQDELNHHLLGLSLTKDSTRIRVWREDDLSTVVAYQGKEMTLRKLFFGKLYDDAHPMHLTRYFKDEGRFR